MPYLLRANFLLLCLYLLRAAKVHQVRAVFAENYDQVSEYHSEPLPSSERYQEQSGSEAAAEKCRTDQPVPPGLAIVTICKPVRSDRNG
jgi:hypothetical protein